MDPTQTQRSPVAIFDHVRSDWQRDFELLRVSNKSVLRPDANQSLTLGTFWSHKDLDQTMGVVLDTTEHSR